MADKERTARSGTDSKYCASAPRCGNRCLPLITPVSVTARFANRENSVQLAIDRDSVGCAPFPGHEERGFGKEEDHPAFVISRAHRESFHCFGEAGGQSVRTPSATRRPYSPNRGPQPHYKAESETSIKFYVTNFRPVIPGWAGSAPAGASPVPWAGSEQKPGYYRRVPAA